MTDLLVAAPVVLIVAVVALLFYVVPVGLWVTALFSGVRVSLAHARRDAAAQGRPR
jgi:uncharacterized protein YqfA (UPF0365 family)